MFKSEVGAQVLFLLHPVLKCRCNLGDGASQKELYDAYNQAIASEERARIHVFALLVTLLYPLPKVETLISLQTDGHGMQH